MALIKSQRRSVMSEALETIEATKEVDSKQKNIIEVRIDLIDSPPYHDRTSHSESAIHVLATNIQEIGLLSPVILRIHNGRYQRIAGFRRIEAMKILKRDSVPAIIVNVSEEVATLMMLSENVLRENLNPYDEFVAILSLASKYLQMDDNELKAFIYRVKNFRSGNRNTMSESDRENLDKLNEVLQKIGRFTYDGILNRMRILSLPDVLKGHIRGGTISYLIAVGLSKFKEELNFLEYISKAIEGAMSIREVDAMFKELMEKKKKVIGEKKIKINPFSGFVVKEKEWNSLSDELRTELVEKFEEIHKMLGR